MHMQLLHTDHVIIFDRTDFGFSNISLPDGRCRLDTGEAAANVDCTAHSVEYDVAANSVRPLMVLTNLWCSSGSVSPNGTLVENNLYPFVFLNTDGNLFIFANNRAILFDYSNDKVVKTYPSSGSAVLLPLKDNVGPAEVLVCGGAPIGSVLKARNRKFFGALNTCGRIRINDPEPQWEIETMPLRIRVVMPGSGNFAPAGYYMVFVVHRDVPSEGIWVQIK